MSGFQDESNVKVDIEKGRAPEPSVEDIGKMLWIEGFAYPTEKGSDGEFHYAVVTIEMVTSALENLYQVRTPARLVLRWLRRVGLIQYGDPWPQSDGSVSFRYVCANAARGRAPTTIEDADKVIRDLESMRQMRWRSGTPETPEEIRARTQEED